MINQDCLGQHAGAEFAQDQLHGIRVPRMTGLPSMMSGLISMRP
jgi:hypothetical protein